MANIYSYRDSNIRKTYLIFTIFLVVIIGLGFIFSQIYGNSLILVIAVIFSVISSFVGYWYSDKIALAVSGAKLIEKNDAPELYRTVENLAIASGLPTPKPICLRPSVHSLPRTPSPMSSRIAARE